MQNLVTMQYTGHNEKKLSASPDFPYHAASMAPTPLLWVDKTKNKEGNCSRSFCAFHESSYDLCLRW